MKLRLIRKAKVRKERVNVNFAVAPGDYTGIEEGKNKL